MELEVVNPAFSFNPDMVEISSAEPVPLGYPLPEKSVLLPNYLIAKDETTFSQWDYVVKKAKVKLNWTIAAGVAGSGYTDVSVPTPQHPVTHITFVDAALWCNAASIMAGLEPCYSTKDSNSQIIPLTPSSLNQAQANGIVWSKQANGYRFPTGDEWEVAARGGLKSQVYPWGNTSANAQNSNWVIFTGYPNNTTPVGTYPRNGFGLSDCAGNVLEITWDTTLDPADEVPTELKNYVVRGGGWQQGYQPKITFGWAGRPFWDSSDAFGFRLARNASNMLTVQGGSLPAGSALANQTVSAFQIARFETTWGEWKTVRNWAAANGYDIGNSGTGITDDQPAMSLNWYDVVKWCNAKSQADGLTPVYSKNGTTYKTGQIIPTINSSANGYRLLRNAEWEWAARGGVLSKNYTYSGGNDLNAVAWYPGNLGSGPKKPQRVGTKAPNELGIYDMTGNMWEWCFDEDLPGFRIGRGGSFYEDATDYKINTTNRLYPSIAYISTGLRLARNASSGLVSMQEDFETTPSSAWKLSANGGGIYQTTNSTAQSGSKSLKLGIGQYQGGQNDSWASAQLSFPEPITNGSVEMYIYTQSNSPFYIYPHLLTESKDWDAGVWIVDSSNTISPGWFETLESQSTAQKITGWQRFKWIISNGKVELWIGSQLIGKAAYKAPPKGLEVSMTSYFVSNVATYIDNVKVEIQNQ